jgi:predicted nucleotidyltransferase component of viral defense system
VPEGGISARCYAYEEVFGEKVRALAERTRPRDLYDVVNLFRHDEFPPHAATVLGVLQKNAPSRESPYRPSIPSSALWTS